MANNVLYFEKLGYYFMFGKFKYVLFSSYIPYTIWSEVVCGTPDSVKWCIMGDYLHFLANGRRPTLFGKLKTTLNFGKWKTTLFFWQIGRLPKF
jgi:hypothetical protein